MLGLLQIGIMWYEQFAKIAKTIQLSVNIYFKGVLSLLIARSQPSLEEAFLELKYAVKRMRLTIQYICLQVRMQSKVSK
jgi:hypothetical protein